MSDDQLTVFRGFERIATGPRAVLEAQLTPLGPHPTGVLVFNNQSGRETDLNLTGQPIEARAPLGAGRPDGTPRRGRPKLGVKAREVTLLPKHWDWLSAQPGGASKIIRTLIDQAMSAPTPNPDAAFRFLTAIAGDLEGFETAIRALYQGDRDGFHAAMALWPADVAGFASELACLAPTTKD
ncbi:MAG: DUF2239 family protein [Maritimibacter sp.]